jgi:hypothetical protein
MYKTYMSIKILIASEIACQHGWDALAAPKALWDPALPDFGQSGIVEF